MLDVVMLATILVTAGLATPSEEPIGKLQQVSTVEGAAKRLIERSISQSVDQDLFAEQTEGAEPVQDVDAPSSDDPATEAPSSIPWAKLAFVSVPVVVGTTSLASGVTIAVVGNVGYFDSAGTASIEERKGYQLTELVGYFVGTTGALVTLAGVGVLLSTFVLGE